MRNRSGVGTRLPASFPLALRVTSSFCVVLAAVSVLHPAWGLGPVTLTGDASTYNLGPLTEYFEDARDEWSLEEVVAGKADALFRANDGEAINLGFQRTPHWFRFTLANDGPLDQVWVLEVGNPRLNLVEGSGPDGSGKYQTRRIGNSLPFDERTIDHHNPVFSFVLPGQSTNTYVLRIDHKGSLRFDLRLMSPQAFNRHQFNAQMVQGGFFGALIFMCVFNTFVFFVLRSWKYLYYALHVACFTLWSMALLGPGYRFLWPNSPWWADRSTLVFFCLTMITGFAFSRLFLDARNLAPRFDKAIIGFMIVSALDIPFSMLGNVYGNQLGHVIGFFGPVTVLVCGIVCWVKGNSVARYLVTAWSVVVLGSVLFALMGPGWVPKGFASEYSIQIGFLIALLFFGMALADQMHQRTRERRIQLEREVEKRTRQLQDALDNIKTLKGLIPVCSSCKKIRDDDGFWTNLEAYLAKHSDAELTHGYCPDCLEERFGKEIAPRRVKQHTPFDSLDA